MRKEIEIQTPQGTTIVNQDKLFIIAEVGNQFNGSACMAKGLAKAAKDAGADAVKYIFWYPDEILADKSIMYKYDVVAQRVKADGSIVPVTKQVEEPLFDLLDRLRLSIHEWASVKAFCDRIGIIMMTTVTSPSAWDLAMGLGLPALKLSSWSWNFPDLWDWCAKSYLPCFADLGPVTSEEVEKNIKIFDEALNRSLALLYCFHTQNWDEFNMSAIPFVAEKFDCLVGYASTDYNDETDIMAVSLGACILEKRLTMNRKGGVLHDALSKEPEEFKEYVAKMRKVKEALGKTDLIPSQNDLVQREKWFRRIVADCNIEKGDIITRNMLEAKRGETGISPERIWDFVGKKATRDIKKNEDIRPQDVA